MLRSLLVIIELLLFGTACASLITVSGNVSGTWSADTVMVIGDVTVPSGQTLTIQPGTQVQFTGQYVLLVQGRLMAVGIGADSIIFTRAYPTEESKWAGIRLDGADNASLLEYCRLEWAKRTGTYPAVHGGAVWINNSSPTVRHCRIANCYSHNSNYNGMGAGICLDQNSNSLLEYNHILLNQADSGGGICVGSECDPVIRHNLIENNQGFYAGGGIYVAANGRATICNNVIRNNSSGGYGGGGINLWSATWMYGTFSDVYNNLITSNNGGSAGGGIYSRYDASLIHNNTIVGNQATSGGGVYVLTFANLPPTLNSNILWDNLGTNGSQLFLDPQSGSTAHVSYCDIFGGWPGIGNLNSDPMFVQGPEGGYYLSQIESGQPLNSPCVDSGDPTATMITGTTRSDQIQDLGVVDIGYHYACPTVQPSNLEIILDPQNPPIVIPPQGGTFEFIATLTNNGSTWVAVTVWIKVQLPNGLWYGPVMGPLQLMLPNNQSISRLRQQNVPAAAPPGMYTYRGWVGIIDSSSFTFSKTGVQYGGTNASDWTCFGEPFPGEKAELEIQPSCCQLFDAAPNPFNPTTTIGYKLDAANHVSLKVYDSEGRLITSLVEGWRKAGSHEVTFDGSGLASGLYFVRLQTGDFAGMRKMILMK